MSILEFVYTIWYAPKLNFRIKKSLNIRNISGKDLVDYYVEMKKNGSYPIKEEVHKFFLCYTFCRIQSKYPKVDLTDLFFQVVDFDFIYRPELAYRGGDYNSPLEKRFKRTAKELALKFLATANTLSIDITAEFTESSQAINDLLSDVSVSNQEMDSPLRMTRHYLIGTSTTYTNERFFRKVI